IVATHGRGFWILDNITPLRQINTKQREDLLFKPQSALRVRANLNTDTPLPPDEPAGENPPDGAMIDYFLSKDARVQVTIEIKDGKGQSVRKYSSTDRPIEVNPKRLKIPSYWIRPLQSVSTKAGLHRFLWDMHYTPVRDVEPEFPICATYRNTAPAATSPWAAPGDYMITLTVDGKTFSQPLAVAMDPRVKASGADLQEQFDLSWKLYQLRLKLAPVGKKFDGIAEQLTKLRAKAAERSDVTQKLEDEQLRRGERKGASQTAVSTCRYSFSLPPVTMRTPVSVSAVESMSNPEPRPVIAVARDDDHTNGWRRSE